MSRTTLLVDATIAAILTVLVVVLAPGLAVVGLIALLLVLVCLVSFGIDALRRRSRRRSPEPLRPSPARSPTRSRSRRPR